MKDVSASFYIEGFEDWVFDGPFKYRAFVEYRQNGRFDKSRDFETGGTLKDVRQFTVTLSFGSDVCGGDFVQWCSAPWRNRRTGEQGTIEGLGCTWNIVGENPTKETIKKRLGKLERQVVGFQESRFRQFAADGRPLFGPSDRGGGFGVMQLDYPPPSARQLWDWSANVADGIKRIAGKEKDARTYPARVRRQMNDPTIPDFTADQLRLETWQRYNGGAYWKWKKDQEQWVAEPPNEYARTLSSFYDGVKGGKPPRGW